MTTLDFGPTTTALATLVRGVGDDQLDGPTPNTGRSVGDLLDHIGGLALAGLGLGLLVARLAMGSFKHKVTAGQETMLGARAEVTDWAGLSGHVFLRGERCVVYAGGERLRA